MDYIIFSNDEFIMNKNGSEFHSESKMIRQYMDNCLEMRKSNEWKTNGSGAAFRRNEFSNFNENIEKPLVIDMISAGNSSLYYTLYMNESGGIFKKSMTENGEEGFIFSSTSLHPKNIDKFGNKLIASIYDPENCTSHLAVFTDEKTDFEIITYGDSKEEYPFCSGSDIYFSSSGIYRDNNGDIFFNNKGISKYNLQYKQIYELYSDPKYDFLSPKTDKNGDLYVIRRPSDFKNNSRSVIDTVIDIVTFPFWLACAIGSFLGLFVTLFTKKDYSGAKNEKNAKETAKQVIEDQQIDVRKEMKKNKKAGEKFPGYIPSSWQLIKIPGGGNVTDQTVFSELMKNAEIIKKGVMKYEITGEGIIYSNGNNIIINKDGKETLLKTVPFVGGHFTVEE